MQQYHLKHKNDQWVLEKSGADRASKVFEDLTKQEALKKSSEYMQDHPGSLVIHKVDNQFQEERTYPRSKDPRESPG